MRQLRQEGWIHHLGRHAVACFLTRGGCYVDWERGAEVFEEWLIDHETACNAGNWQWLSCTAFYSQFYRCYSPIAFPKKSDKGGAFVRHFVPELEDFPDKYIYEPWKAPIADQKKAKCIIKGDGNEPQDEVYDPRDTTDGTIKTYPKPMFDFDQRRTICIEALKSAYKVNLYGDDPRVKDGTWKSLFPDSAEGPTEGNEPPSGAGGKSDGPTREVGGEMKGEALRGRGRGIVKKDVDTEKEDGGVDQDEREAAEVGGETKGGEKQGVGKRKRQRQVTLDGIVERGGKRGR